MSAQPNSGPLADFRAACRRAGVDRGGALPDHVCTALDQVKKDNESVEEIYRLYTLPEKPDYKEIGRIVATRILTVHAKHIQDWTP